MEKRKQGTISTQKKKRDGVQIGQSRNAGSNELKKGKGSRLWNPHKGLSTRNGPRSKSEKKGTRKAAAAKNVEGLIGSAKEDQKSTFHGKWHAPPPHPFTTKADSGRTGKSRSRAKKCAEGRSFFEQLIKDKKKIGRQRTVNRQASTILRRRRKKKDPNPESKRRLPGKGF